MILNFELKENLNLYSVKLVGIVYAVYYTPYVS